MSSIDDFVIRDGVLEKYTGTDSDIVIPGGVTRIKENAFAGLLKVTRERVSEAELKNRFLWDIYETHYISKLRSVTLPDSIRVIEKNVFDRFYHLDAVYIGDIAAWCGIAFETVYSNPLYYAKNLYINGEPAAEPVIPCGVEAIGDYAFCCCKSLKSVTVPDSVTRIGRSAFAVCTGLTSVTLPDSIKEMGSGAFSGCSELTSINIPDSITSLPDGVFPGCTSLSSISIPDSVKSLGKGAFRECSGLTSITLPGGIKEIGAGAFRECSGLTSIKIPDSTKSFGELAFYGCDKLTSISIPDSVTEIGERAFNKCSGLTSITIPGSVTNIARYAFGECFFLTSVTIQQGVTGLADEAFSRCTELNSITIPDSVTVFGSDIFNRCGSLESVYFKNRAFNNIPEEFRNRDVLLTFVKNYYDDCPSEEIIKSYAAYFKEQMYTDGGFRYIAAHTELIFFGIKYSLMTAEEAESVFSLLPENRRIEERAALIEYISSRSDIIDRLSPEYTPLDEILKEWKFRRDKAGTAVLTSYIGSSGKAICPLSISGSRVTEIGEDAFYKAKATSVIVSESITDIGCRAFKSCISLISVTVPDSVTNINQQAFRHCESLKSVILSRKTTKIEDRLFEGCIALEAITIPDGVTSIGSRAFFGCSELTSITIPESVTELGDGVFFGCRSLTSITLPDSVKSIGKEAFNYCPRLRTVYVGKNTEIADTIFDDCPLVEIIRR